MKFCVIQLKYRFLKKILLNSLLKLKNFKIIYYCIFILFYNQSNYNIYISLFIRSQYNQYNKRIEFNKIYFSRNNFIYFELFGYVKIVYIFFRI